MRSTGGGGFAVNMTREREREVSFLLLHSSKCSAERCGRMNAEREYSRNISICVVAFLQYFCTPLLLLERFLFLNTFDIFNNINAMTLKDDRCLLYWPVVF